MSWREASASILAQVANTTEAIVQPETVDTALNALKGTLLLLALFLLLGIIVVVIRSQEYLRWELREKLRGTDQEHIPPARMRRRWRNIIRQLRSKGDNAYKLAVIDADKIVDDFLEKFGYRGDTMANKLNQINPDELKTLANLWEAHKIRNSIVHDLKAEVTRKDAFRAVKAFQDTLEELQVL